MTSFMVYLLSWLAHVFVLSCIYWVDQSVIYKWRHASSGFMASWSFRYCTLLLVWCLMNLKVSAGHFGVSGSLGPLLVQTEVISTGSFLMIPSFGHLLLVVSTYELFKWFPHLVISYVMFFSYSNMAIWSSLMVACEKQTMWGAVFCFIFAGIIFIISINGFELSSPCENSEAFILLCEGPFCHLLRGCENGSA